MGSTHAFPARTVVFDLGGVMAKICHTWQKAAEAARIPVQLDTGDQTALIDFGPFNDFQRGKLQLDSYLNLLSSFLGCSEAGALMVHNGILCSEYPGIPGLVRDLLSAHVKVGCLSNTNAPHWAVLTSKDHYPTVASLELKMASHEVGLEKPNPAIFELYEKAFSLSPTEIVFFDDNWENAKIAGTLGWNVLRIDPESDPPAQMRRHLAEIGVLSDTRIA